MLCASYLFKSIDVLSVVAQQFARLLQTVDELVTRGRRKLPGVNLFGEFEKGPRVLSRIFNQ